MADFSRKNHAISTGLLSHTKTNVHQFGRLDA